MDLCFLKNIEGRATTRTLVAAIVQAIEGGLLNGGERLPSSREIAQITCTSRTTVVRAFEELVARGYLTGKKGQATFVAQNCSLPAVPTFAPDTRPEGAPQNEQKAKTFSTELPSNLLPVREWQKCIAHQTTRMLSAGEGNPFDLAELKLAICGFLRRTEGILATPANIFIFTGTDSALTAAAKLTEGRALACENKNSPAFKHFEKHGARVVELSIDSGGTRTDALGTTGDEISWLYVAPAGSRPNGIVLSNERRYSLLEWARIHSVSIIENATGSEFQYSAQTSPSLFSQDRTGSVICYRSFAALLRPLVNLEFLIVPDELLQHFLSVYHEPLASPLIEHPALAEFINDGSLERHIRATWKILRRRRQALIFSLKQKFDNKIEIFSSHAGTQIIAKFNQTWTSGELLKSARAAGLVMELNTITGDDSQSEFNTQFDLKSETDCEFAIDFSKLPEENSQRTIDAFAEGLHQSFNPPSASPYRPPQVEILPLPAFYPPAEIRP